MASSVVADKSGTEGAGGVRTCNRFLNLFVCQKVGAEVYQIAVLLYVCASIETVVQRNLHSKAKFRNVNVELFTHRRR